MKQERREDEAAKRESHWRATGVMCVLNVENAPPSVGVLCVAREITGTAPGRRSQLGLVIKGRLRLTMRRLLTTLR